MTVVIIEMLEKLQDLLGTNLIVKLVHKKITW